MSKEKKETPEEALELDYHLPDDSAGFALAERATWHLLEKKAEDLVVMDMRGRSDVCDFLVLASGSSKNQVNALAKHVHNALLNSGHKPKGLEGMNDGRWALLDFFDVVVHVFHQSAREYFMLEKLWNDSPRLSIDFDWYGSEDVAGRHPDLKFNMGAGSDGAE